MLKSYRYQNLIVQENYPFPGAHGKLQFSILNHHYLFLLKRFLDLCILYVYLKHTYVCVS